MGWEGGAMGYTSLQHIIIAASALPCNVHMVQKGNMRTYRMTNFRGFSDRTGNRAKQMTKQARAPRLQAVKMSNRSHRLTVGISPEATKSASFLESDFKKEHNQQVQNHMFRCGNETDAPVQYPFHRWLVQAVMGDWLPARATETL